MRTDSPKGPAFPVPMLTDGNVAGDVNQHGMSIRAYFAAHAPAEPQPWFTPYMPPRPERPPQPTYGGVWTREMVERASDWCRDDAGADIIAFAGDDLTLDQTSALIGYGERVAQADRAYAEWWKQRERQLFIQWPWAYADAVLAAGGDL